MDTNPESSRIATVDLLHVPTGEMREAELLRGLSSDHVESIEDTWEPAIREALRDIRARCQSGEIANEDAAIAEMRARNIEDWHWDWRTKYDQLGLNGSYSSFVVTCDECVQGVMYATTKFLSRLPSQHQQPMVYIDYLAVAPWNRSTFSHGVRTYSGIGTILAVTAISWSMDQGWNGRVGLHALQQACPFYEGKLGMTDLGPDLAKQGLHYFETFPADARRLLVGI